MKTILQILLEKLNHQQIEPHSDTKGHLKGMIICCDECVALFKCFRRKKASQICRISVSNSQFSLNDEFRNYWS